MSTQFKTFTLDNFTIRQLKVQVGVVLSAQHEKLINQSNSLHLFFLKTLECEVSTTYIIRV